MVLYPFLVFFSWSKLYGSGSGTCEVPILWDLGVWFLSFTMFHPLKYSRCLLSMKGKHQLPECKRLEKKVDVAHSTGSKNLQRLSSQAFPGFIFEILHYHTQKIVNFNTKSHCLTISYSKYVYIYIYHIIHTNQPPKCSYRFYSYEQKWVSDVPLRARWDVFSWPKLACWSGACHRTRSRRDTDTRAFGALVPWGAGEKRIGKHGKMDRKT